VTADNLSICEGRQRARRVLQCGSDRQTRVVTRTGTVAVSPTSRALAPPTVARLGQWHTRPLYRSAPRSPR